MNTYIDSISSLSSDLTANRKKERNNILPKKIKAIIERKTDGEAKHIVSESSTVARVADQFGRTLKAIETDPASIYFKRGELSYKRYCSVLLRKVEALQEEKGMKRTNVRFTPWDEL